jgi:hypothetical protein
VHHEVGEVDVVGAHEALLGHPLGLQGLGGGVRHGLGVARREHLGQVGAELLEVGVDLLPGEAGVLVLGGEDREVEVHQAVLVPGGVLVVLLPHLRLLRLVLVLRPLHRLVPELLVPGLGQGLHVRRQVDLGEGDPVLQVGQRPVHLLGHQEVEHDVQPRVGVRDVHHGVLLGLLRPGHVLLRRRGVEVLHLVEPLLGLDLLGEGLHGLQDPGLALDDAREEVGHGDGRGRHLPGLEDAHQLGPVEVRVHLPEVHPHALVDRDEVGQGLRQGHHVQRLLHPVVLPLGERVLDHLERVLQVGHEGLQGDDS